MEEYKGFFVDGAAKMVHPFDLSWYPGGSVLRPGRGGSIIEVARFELPKFTLELKGVAEWFGFELSKLIVDECSRGLLQKLSLQKPYLY
jgi:hypothetical protein